MSLSAYVSAVLADTPRAFWKQDEASGLPQDSSGNGLHMTGKTIASNHYQQTGPFAGWVSILYTGGESAVRGAISTQQDNITWEEWIYLEAVGANNQAIWTNNAGGNGWDFDFNTDRTGHAVVQGIAAQANSSALSLNTWYHIVVKRESGTWKYYLNGAVDNSNAGTSTPGAATVDTRIHFASTTQARHAMTAYYNSALSDARILAHYNAALAPSGPAFVKTVDGLAAASIKTIDGLAYGSIKKRDGLA